MSGGHFDYLQYRMDTEIEEFENFLSDKEMLDNNGFSKATVDELEACLVAMKRARVYIHRVDWLVSADDGEETFHERLKEDLSKL